MKRDHDETFEPGFPRWIYFAGGRSVLVKSGAHLEAQPAGWADTPAAFVPGEPAVFVEPPTTEAPVEVPPAAEAPKRKGNGWKKE